MTQEEQKPIIHHYILSDSVGETGIKVASSVMSQFPKAQSVLHRHTFISNEDTLLKVLGRAQQKKAYIYLTLANDKLAKLAEDYAQEHHLKYINLIQPIAKSISELTGLQPSQKVGAQHVLNDSYFKRVNAIEFSIAADDGQDPSLFHKADILLIGISRTGKTPLSMYLGTLGFKTANLPLIPENGVPDCVYEVNPKKIVGLTNDVAVLNRHRINRMREYGMPENSRYSSERRILEELTFSEKIFKRLGCPIINVSERSIEESASIILNVLGMEMPF